MPVPSVTVIKGVKRSKHDAKEQGKSMILCLEHFSKGTGLIEAGS